jgi:hypothetical protein
VFEHPIQSIKEHPYVAAGAVAGVVLLYVVYKAAGGGSSGAVATVGGSPSDAAIQAGAAVQIAQIQGAQSSSNLQAQLAGHEYDTAATVTIAGLNADVAKYQTEQQANVQQAGIAAQEHISDTSLQTQQIISVAQLATQSQIASYANQTVQVGYQENTKQIQSIEGANVAIAQSHDQAFSSVAKQQSSNSLWGGIIGGVLALI